MSLLSRNRPSIIPPPAHAKHWHLQSSTPAVPQARRHELSERTRAVTDGVLFGRVQFAERLPSAAWQEHRVVAEALVATRRPCRLPIDAAEEGLGVAVRPGEAQRGDEPGTAVRGGIHL